MAVDRFVDERADRFIVEIPFDAADDLDADLFGRLEDFEQRADGFFRALFAG